MNFKDFSFVIFGVVWNMILKNNEKFKMYFKIIIFLIYFIFLEIVKIVIGRISINLLCNNGY